MDHHHFNQPSELSILTYSCSKDCTLDKKIELLHQIVETPFVHCIIHNAWSNFPQIGDVDIETQQCINQLLKNKHIVNQNKLSNDVFLIDKHLCPKTHVSKFDFALIGDSGTRVSLTHGHQHNEQKLSESMTTKNSRTPPSHLYFYTIYKKTQSHNVFQDLDQLVKCFFDRPYIMMTNLKGETIEEIAFQLSARKISFIACHPTLESINSSSSSSTAQTCSDNLFLLYPSRYFRSKNNGQKQKAHNNIVTLTIRGHDVDDLVKEQAALKLRNHRLTGNLTRETKQPESTAGKKNTAKSQPRTFLRPPALLIPKGGFEPVPECDRPPPAPRSQMHSNWSEFINMDDEDF